ncbi:MAG TPA: YdeI/OmpD-associated family protein [Cyclobacteriaceae bacterium]|nr:YdeI/OmpD-associated family protein [Cyclobacteriaceae bacterium]HMV07538.1 YdeI/OmpD-associated family protein [Cyclobacteriaceae bacterium]HMV90163.1 YdeI/OmpD-associated family protein [Cyclobacteriaceae bacterium]HMX02814.1 YdeI/OmpD-associated family protein [Cyclobacteriaceae bacterium]HMX52123.1 YdeI/OmpD-associated family protein [Cyclobacteriaceae bacterium]
MVTLTCRIEKSPDKGGWSYIIIDKKHAEKLKPGTRTSFRVKGTLDKHRIERTSLLPIREGRFMLPVNGAIRKATGKKAGDKITVSLMLDESKIVLSADLMTCLKDDVEAMKFFKSLPGSHQKYYSKWIETAKSAHTKTKRIAFCLTAFSKHLNFTDMMKEYKNFEG